MSGLDWTTTGGGWDGMAGAGVSPVCNEKTKKATLPKIFKKQKGIELEQGEKGVTGTVKMALRMRRCAE